MKIKSIILSILCVAMLALTVAGCGCNSTQPSSDVSGVEKTFKATVTEMNDDTMKVRINNNQPEAEIAKFAEVNINIEDKPEKLEPGKSVIITYNGEISESDPAKVTTVYKINLVDVKGNVIEN